jgi:hypothetical protein
MLASLFTPFVELKKNIFLGLSLFSGFLFHRPQQPPVIEIIKHPNLSIKEMYTAFREHSHLNLLVYNAIRSTDIACDAVLQNLATNVLVKLMHQANSQNLESWDLTDDTAMPFAHYLYAIIHKKFLDTLTTLRQRWTTNLVHLRLQY